MPRLFTGLTIPPSLKSQLAFYRGGLMGARWADPDDYHLTLRFIGDVDERTACQIADALEAINTPPFSVEISHLDVFGGNRPHSLYVAVKPSPALLKLQADHERLLRRMGLEAESRKFTPHITLARLNREASPRNVADYLSLRGGFLPRGFDVDHFTLFSARDGGGGPYVAEEIYELQSRRALAFV